MVPRPIGSQLKVLHHARVLLIAMHWVFYASKLLPSCQCAFVLAF